MNSAEKTNVQNIVRLLIEEWFEKGRQFENETNPFVLDNNAVEFSVLQAVDDIEKEIK